MTHPTAIIMCTRGICKGIIFKDDSDKDYFLYLLARHLSPETFVSKQGHIYPCFRGHIELLSYCLMDNHFHLLFYQKDQTILSALMKSVTVAYTAYFNRKYKRSGPLFESRFKAALITTDTYLLHISRYIHLNPRSWKRFPYSSLLHITKATEPAWLQTERVLSQHASREAYLAFTADYEDYKRMLDELKPYLANS